MRHILRKCIKVYRQRGFSGLAKKIHQKLFGLSDAQIYEKRQMDKADLYAAWRQKHRTSDAELDRQRQNPPTDAPLISIVVPVYNTNPKYLSEFIDSVLGQTVPNWELCLVDGASTISGTKQTLAAYAARDRRIRVLTLTANGGISANTNAGLAAAKGDFVFFSDHDDIIEPNAIYEVTKAILDKQAQVIYSDEDKVNADSSVYYEPHLKPDYSPEKLTACNYFCHLTAVSKPILDKIGYLNPAFDGSQDHELTLRAVEAAEPGRVVHIAQVLYHWRQFGESMSKQHLEKCQAAGRQAVSEHLTRLGLEGEVTQDHGYRVRYKVDKSQRITAVVLVKDDCGAALERLDKLQKATAWDNFKILAVNLTDEETPPNCGTALECLSGEKNMTDLANLNRAAAMATGDFLLFLDEYIVCNHADWLTELVMYARQPDIGIIGGKIFLPDNERIFATNYLLTATGPIREHFGHSRLVIGDGGQERIVRNVSALPLEMMLLPREVFKRADGFDETYPKGWGEAELAIRLLRLKYRHVTTPFAEVHLIKTAVDSKFIPGTAEVLHRFLSGGDDYVYDRYNRIPYDAIDLKEAVPCACP